MQIFKASTVAFGLLLSTVSAHMLLSSPKPFVYNGDNGPLVGTGKGSSNYPCKLVDPSAYNVDWRTKLSIGSNFTANFLGTAVHGGGSCQFSLTKDLHPTANSVFKVIYSIEGGCPARDTDGNLQSGSGATSQDPFTYPLNIPQGLEVGDYTFAWTWMNRKGNREFYMNCSPVTLVDDGHAYSDSSYFDSLPNIALANIPDVTCTTEGMEPKAYQYENPGQFLDVDQGVPLAPMVKNCYLPAGSTASKGNVSTSPHSSENLSSQAATANRGSSTSQTLAVSGYGTLSSSGSLIASTAPTAQASTNSTQSSTNAGGGTSLCQRSANEYACTTSGFYCINGTHFGLCNNGCAIPQAMADGTACEDGQIAFAQGWGSRARHPQHRRHGRI